MPPKYMDALGAISASSEGDEDSDDDDMNAVEGGADEMAAGAHTETSAATRTTGAGVDGAAAKTKRGGVTRSRNAISYEDLQARGLSRASLLDMPVPEEETADPSNKNQRSVGEKIKRRNASDGEEDDDEDEVFKNPFGKWELSRSKTARSEAARAEEAAERRANRGPTWGEQRGAALRAHAQHYMTHQVDRFDVGRAKGAAAAERSAEAAARARSGRDKEKETTRQKNRRKEQRGQAKFTLKEARDCPDIWRR